MFVKPKLKENKDSSAVFANGFLSKETLDLLNYARALKNVGYSFVFATGGRIFYKKSETSKAQVVRCEEDVDKLLMSVTTFQSWKRRSMGNNNAVQHGDGTNDDDVTESYASPS